MTARAILLQLQPIRVIPLVLECRVCSLLAFSAGKGYDYSIFIFCHIYSIILMTVPAPTVLPPSRMENFMPGSIATG